MSFKIEAGKFYKTRDGKKAYVSGSSPFPSIERYPFVGWIEDNEGKETWRIDGTFCSEGESGYDLVAEWKEPKRIKGWLNVDADGHSGFHQTRGEADKQAFKDRIACIAIDAPEGEGL